MSVCRSKDNLGIQCERERVHKGRHCYALAIGGVYWWRRKRPGSGGTVKP